MKNIQKLLIECSNESDHQLLTNVLRNKGIDFVERIFADSAFPGLNDSLYSQIKIDEISDHDYRSLAFYIRMEDYSINIQYKRPKNTINKLLLIYAIIATGLLIKFGHRAYISSNQDKNFIVKWNYSNSVVEYTDKKTDKLSSKFYDSNYDLNFERIEDYYPNGQISTLYFDKDENGYSELFFGFDENGNQILRCEDRDNDGNFDYLKMITEKDMLTFYDKNKNGQWD